MKKSLFILALLTAAVCGCQVAQIEEPAAVPEGNLTLVGQSGPDTKTSIGAVTEAGWPVLWEEGDVIGLVSSDGVFANERGNLKTGAGTQEGTFRNETAKKIEAESNLFIYYPYNAGVTIDIANLAGTGINIPAAQTATAGSTAGIGANSFAFATAKLEPGDGGNPKPVNFTLAHANAYVQLAFAGANQPTLQLKSIKVEAEKAIAGEGLAFALTTGAITAPEAAATSKVIDITLTEPAAVEGAKVWFTAMPVDLTGGNLVVTATLTDGIEDIVADPVSIAAKTLRAGSVNVIAIPALTSAAPAPKTAIHNAEELLAFLTLGKAASDYSNAYYYFANDIDMTGVVVPHPDTIQHTVTLDGRGYSIKNHTATGDPIINSNFGTIKNLTLDPSCVFNIVPTTTATTYNSILVGRNESTGIMEKCICKATIPAVKEGSWGATNYVSTLAYVSYNKMIDCENYSDIDIDLTACKLNYIGGLTSYFNDDNALCCRVDPEYVAFQGCKNYGNIKIHCSTKPGNMFFGGISGCSTPTNYSKSVHKGNVVNCVNYGNLSYTFDAIDSGTYVNMGGIVGYLEGSMIDCVNNGKIEYINVLDPSDDSKSATRPAVGGCAGAIRYNMENCVNNGEIYIECNATAGTMNASGAAAIHNPTFGGVVGQVGGFVASGSATSSNPAYTADHANNANLHILNCINNGKFTSKGNMKNTGSTNPMLGGVVGVACAVTKGCVNNGEVMIYDRHRGTYAGGVVGRAYQPVIDCVNDAPVTYDFEIAAADGNRSQQVFLGGVAGHLSQKGYNDITNCRNTKKGTVTVKNGYVVSYSEIGGVFGQSVSSNGEACKASGCYNEADIIVEGHIKACIGGIAGMHDYGIEMTDCHNTGNITVLDGGDDIRVGGICGHTGTVWSHANSFEGSINAKVTGGALYAGFAYGAVGNVAQKWEDLQLKADIVAVADTLYAGAVLGGQYKGHKGETVITMGENGAITVLKPSTINEMILVPTDMDKVVGKLWWPNGADIKNVVIEGDAAAHLFEETFAANNWTTEGSDSSTKLTVAELPNFSSLDNIYWARPVPGGVKLGTSSKTGTLVTKDLDLSQTFTVSVKACSYSATEGALVVSCGDKSYEVDLTNGGKDNKVVQELSFVFPATSEKNVTVKTSEKRIYVQSIVIDYGGTVPEEPTQQGGNAGEFPVNQW